MPDPFNRTKMSGDTHPPEVESDLPLEEGGSSSPAPSGASTPRGTDDAGRLEDNERPGDRQRDNDR